MRLPAADKVAPVDVGVPEPLGGAEDRRKADPATATAMTGRPHAASG
jgi:hypothetical protein